MNRVRIFLLFIITILLQSCASNKSQIFWVSGIKTQCSAGAGKMQCLNIHKNETLNDPIWENFYTNIEGFEFESGYLKKLEVREEKIKNPPADGSSIKYILVKELEKRVDQRVQIAGTWILTSLDDNPINRSVRLPEIKLGLNDMRVEGNGGCNTYSGKIKELTFNTIHFTKIINTAKACLEKNIEQEYFKALGRVNTFQIKGENLVFLDDAGRRILSYHRKKEMVHDQRLHDIWITKKIMGSPINRMSSIPRMEINLTEMKIFGNNGCNDFNGKIKNYSETELVFGHVATTKKMCRKMKVANSFNKAMAQVKSYKLDGLSLSLFDEYGNEIFEFFKGD